MATSVIHKEQITRIFGNSAISLSAGNIGTYATGNVIAVAVSGYKPISCTVMSIGHPGGYIPVIELRADRGELQFIFYRGTSAAFDVAQNDISVKVVYEKV